MKKDKFNGLSLEHKTAHLKTICQIHQSAKLKYFLLVFIDDRFQDLMREDGVPLGKSISFKPGEEVTFVLGDTLRQALFRNCVLELSSIFYDHDTRTISLNEIILDDDLGVDKILRDEYILASDKLKPYRDTNLAHKDFDNLTTDSSSGFTRKDLDEMIKIADKIMIWLVSNDSPYKFDQDGATDLNQFMCQETFNKANSYDSSKNKVIWFFINRLAGLSKEEVTNKMLYG